MRPTLPTSDARLGYVSLAMCICSLLAGAHNAYGQLTFVDMPVTYEPMSDAGLHWPDYSSDLTNCVGGKMTAPVLRTSFNMKIDSGMALEPSCTPDCSDRDSCACFDCSKLEALEREKGHRAAQKWFARDGYEKFRSAGEGLDCSCLDACKKALDKSVSAYKDLLKTMQKKIENYACRRGCAAKRDFCCTKKGMPFPAAPTPSPTLEMWPLRRRALRRPRMPVPWPRFAGTVAGPPSSESIGA